MRKIVMFAAFGGMIWGGSGPVRAATDFVCMANCQQAGYMYQYCQSRCSYDTGAGTGGAFMGQNQGILPNAPQAPLRTDFQCMADCAALGYTYRLCKGKCSY